MGRHVKTIAAGSILLLFLALGWIYRLELLEWFAPEMVARYQPEHAHERGEGDIAYWTCPMHPSVKAEEPGPCPICGMDLQPVPVAQVVEGETPATQPTTQPAAGVPGFITLTPWQQQLIGVTTAPVEWQPAQAAIRTVGRVDYDETRLADVNLKVRGWIEELYVDYTGKPVKEGQPLFALYSPELVSTQEEYLLTLRTLQELESGEGAADAPDTVAGEAIARLRSLLESARQRLLWWDLTEAQIRALEEDGKPRRTLTIHAPASGIVIDKMAVEGMYVEPGMRLYRIADLERVWVHADVYEYELPFVREGQQATMTLSYLPGQSFQGEVDYIYPYLEAKTRTAKVRLRFPNPHLRLRPEMFAEVSLEVNAGEQLVVPESAVLFSGQRRLVFVDLGEGRFQPRQVRLGVRLRDYYQVLEGLQEGERVVAPALFLIDSESKLKNVLGGMASPYEQQEGHK